jgi:hypothetical protein
MTRRLSPIILGLACFACGGNDGPNQPNAPASRLQLSVSGLRPLANGFHYEGWAIVDGRPFSTGKFNVTDGGGIVGFGGTSAPDGAFATMVELAVAEAIVITIEPAGDTDTLPATTKVLAGRLANRSAALTVAAPQALANDFRAAQGTYILATPTDGAGNNETSGIWFLQLVAGSPRASLSLPALPAGWEYEGWVVVGGRPLTTGRFTDPNGPDKAAPYSGPMAGPPFPGEDFLFNAPGGFRFPLDLSGAMAVITIEPEPDDTLAPFSLAPLSGQVPSPARELVDYRLENRADALARGTASIR